MIEPNLIWQKFLTVYKLPTGLARLQPGEGHNDNGILFLAFTHVLAKLSGVSTDSERPEVIKAMEGTKSAIKGQFLRQPNDNRTNSHDNYVAICVLSRMYNLEYGADLFTRGLKTFFRFDGEQSQGGDVWFYLVMSGRWWQWLLMAPFFLLFLHWYVAGSLIGIYKGNASTKNIALFRAAALLTVGPLVFKPLGWVLLRLALTKQPYGVQHYYNPDNPIHQFVLNLKESK